MPERVIGVIGTHNLEVLLGPLGAIPRPGELALAHDLDVRMAGSAPSVGLVINALDMHARLFGTVGDDELGRNLIRHLRAKGLDVQGVSIVPRQRTGICVSLTHCDATHRYVSHLGAIEATTYGRLLRNRAAILSCDAVLLTGYFLLGGLGFTGAQRLLKWLRSHGRKTALDTGWDPAQWPPRTRREVRDVLRWVDVFLPNRDEALILSGKKDPADAARALLQLGPEAVFVKLESKGGLVATRSGIDVDAGFPRKIQDTTAAGEAFNGGALYGLGRGLAPAEALAFANATAVLFLTTRDQTACRLASVLKILGNRQISRKLGM